MNQLIHQACYNLGLTCKELNPLMAEVVNRYNEDHRGYHTWEHIEYMLERVPESWATPQLILAILFHDVIYNPKKNDNEKQSAEFAQKELEKLGVPSEVIDQVFSLILSTTPGIHPTSIEQERLNDLDLSVLGDSFSYSWYAQGVRKEYSMYPYVLYKKGRKKVMGMFLQAPMIYLTPEFTHLEHKARKNISNELENL